MLKPFSISRCSGIALLCAALPLAAFAQRSTQDSLLRSGDLVGGRLHAVPARAVRSAAANRAATTSSGADPLLTQLLHESITISRVPAADMPNLYARFMEAVHAQRRQWKASDWEAASACMARLDQRYEAVRKELPLNERLNVRTYQGEFHTFEVAARHR